MSSFRTILAGADFSQASKEAFQVACSLASEGQTRVVLLHVVEPRLRSQEPVYHGQGAVHFSSAAGDTKAEETLLQELRAAYVPNRPIDVQYRTCEGPPAAEILRHAAESGCDLIVMGTHGRTGIRRILAGSVAEAILRGSPCTVMAMRESDESAARETGTILCPTDFSESADAAVQVARSLARDHGARLILLTVVPINVFFNEPTALLMEPELFQAALDDARRELEGPDLKYPIESRLDHGDAAGVILRVAEERGADLIVMGTHGRSGLGRVFMGSVAEAVLRKAHCPLLAVKMPQPSPSATPAQGGGDVVNAL